MHSQTYKQMVLAGLFALSPFANAHTWIEQLMVIAPNGTMVGEPGYARGNVLRSNPSFGDPKMVNILPPDGRTINTLVASDLMCKSTQTTQVQTDGSPRLQAAPGSAVALRYQENGHVSLPQAQAGKPSNRGTVYVYGTTESSPTDSFLAIHRVWNADGTGGDGRGKLLSTQNFDDGQCYQINGGTISQERQKTFSHAATALTGGDIWCQQDIAVPSDAPSGKPYTLYWVWDWPTMPGTEGLAEGKQEIYTTCMDVDIVSEGASAVQSEAAASSFVEGQDINNAAISSVFEDITNPTAVTGSSIPFSASATGPASATSVTVAASETTATGSVPIFLTVHTGSTAGPGIETSVATTSVETTIVPIGVKPTSASQATETTQAQQSQARQSQAQPTQTADPSSASQPSDAQGQGQGQGQGRRTRTRGGSGFGASSQATGTGIYSILSELSSLLLTTTSIAETAASTTVVPIAASSPTIAAQALTTSAVVAPFSNGTSPSMETFTQYDSVTETVFQTVYNTKFTKRTSTFSPSSCTLAPASTSTAPAVAPVFATPPSSSTASQLTITLVTPTAAPQVVPVESSTATPCSKTAAVYRLRARIPFFPIHEGSC